ncbi:heterokaryon incompatibility protein-domain-containing protein [Bisporella sp. PMI_857]|nr:heterokaryon incompatibility protein-domain-containing protein [Bisporella sp. PMI_857]
MELAHSRTTYKYEPLEARRSHIRLLTLHPSQDGRDPITCSVEPHLLELSPPYEALSYAWGNPNDMCPTPIDINDDPINIATNLEAALRVLRYHDRTRILWIDALCINQTDVQEKNCQIAMMGSIYEKADNVLIWLGTRSEDSDLAMSTISNLKSILDFGNFNKETWNALENLFSRAWFRRVWVLQEFKRGRNPVFQCGHASFVWDRTGEILQELWTSNGPVDLKNLKLLGETGKIISMASTRIDISVDANIGCQQAAQNLVRMLRVYCGYQATEAHDKIYGLLGLSNAFLFSNSEPPQIEYQRPVVDVYTDWARFLISTQNGLDILYAARRIPYESDLPSWVPDWRLSRYNLLLTLDVFKDLFWYTGPRVENYDTTPRFYSDKILVVKGNIITTFTGDYVFSNVDRNFVSQKLDSQTPKDLLLSYLMLGCKMKTATVEGFAIQGISEGRKQFRSSQGSTGLVPKATKHGDVMCILGDAKILFVLRPIGKQYKLVGDGYINVGGELDDNYRPALETLTIM